MKEFEIKLNIKMSSLHVLDSKVNEAEEWLRWEIINRQEVEEKIYKQFRLEIERQTGKTVLRAGAWAMVGLPESMYMRK